MDKEKTLRKLKQEIEEVQKKHGVDPIELVGVVRCRDCKSSNIDDRTGRMFCSNPLGGYGCVPTKEDGFCCYGERREQDA